MKLNVLYQFNARYLPFAGVSMTSLFYNNQDIDEIEVHVLLEEIEEDGKESLSKLCKQYGRSIFFYDTSELIILMKQLEIPQYRNSYATNFKLFVTMLCRELKGKVLYLDSDTIIGGSLKDLLELDMGNNSIAMVMDSLTKNHKLRLGHKKNEKYFNAGVILMDLDRWREEKWMLKIIKHVKEIRAHYLAPDQDLINIVFKNKIGTLNIDYNLQPIHFVFGYHIYKILFGQANYYNKDEILKAVNQPKIIHFFRFLGEFPWHKNSMHPFTPQFDKYLQISFWKDYQKKESDKNSFVFKIERCFYRYLPKSLFLILFKINYELLLWKANADSKSSKNNKNI